jgi:CHASE2 domain-containing sensor protein
VWRRLWQKGKLLDVVAGALVALAVTAATVTAPGYWAPFLGTVETWLADLRGAVLAEPLPQDDRLVILVIRDSTLAKLPYVAPIDRALLADAVGAVAKAGPRVLGLDILFTRPTEAAKDVRLRQALAAVQAPVVLAWAEAGQGLSQAEADYLARFAGTLEKGWPNLLKSDRDATVRCDRPPETDPGAMLV